MKMFAAVCGVLVFFLFIFAEVSNAQGVPVPSTVEVSTPDGGLPVTLGAQRVAVEATGPGGSSVAVIGTVGLTSQSIADLTAPVCGQIFPLEKMSVDGGAHIIPPLLADGGSSGDPSRSSITVVNTDTAASHKIACDLVALDGGLPACDTASGTGELLGPGDRMTFGVGSGRPIYCRGCAATGAVTMGWREENCR